MKKCVYCNRGLEANPVIEICPVCMYKVWGGKMSKAIVANAEREKANGNLEFGRIRLEPEREMGKEKKEGIICAEETAKEEKIPCLTESFQEDFESFIR